MREEDKAVIPQILPIQETGGYRIATFNIRKFGWASVRAADNSETKKDLDMIASIIIDNHIDIVAIQEITNKEALKKLIEKVAQCWAKEVVPVEARKTDGLAKIENLISDIAGYEAGSWEGRWAKPKSKYGNNSLDEEDKIAEGYAFLWNKKKIKLVKNYNGDSFEPKIGYNLRGGILIRPPFIGRFMPIRARYEFRLINAHIAWEESKSAKTDADEILSGKELREKELKVLLQTIYSSLAQKQYDVNLKDRHARPLSSYTFLLGDYNLNLPGVGSGARMSDSLGKFSCGKMEIVTVNGKLTTLKKLSAEGKEKLYEESDSRLANNYDHFSYDRKKLIKHEIEDPVVCVVYAFDNYKGRETVESDKYALYFKKVSDHLPVILDIDIRKRRMGG